MLARKNELRATLLLTLCVVCLFPAAAAAGAGDASSPHHDRGRCPSSGVAADCTACSERSSAGDRQSHVERCCVDVLAYSTCRHQLDTVQSKTLAKRSVDDFQQLLDDDDDDKRRTPFLGKRARNPFLGKRRVNPFLGKRRNPFLGKRASSYDLDDVKRRMPFLG